MKKIFLLLLVLSVAFTNAFAFQFTELQKAVNNQICVAQQIIPQVNNANLKPILMQIVSEMKEINISNGTIEEYSNITETAKNLSSQFRSAIHLMLNNTTIDKIKYHQCYYYNLARDRVRYMLPKTLSETVLQGGVTRKALYDSIYSYLKQNHTLAVKSIPKGYVYTNIVRESEDQITLLRMEKNGQVTSLRQYVNKKLGESK